MAGNKKSMMDMSAELFEQARKKKNSAEFDEVIKALIQINDYNKKKVSEVSTLDYMKAQKHLIDACEKYTSKKGKAFSKDGRARLELIGSICDLAKSEDYRDVDVPKLAASGKTWGAASAESRIVKKDVDTDKVIRTAGAGTSQRNVYADGFYTPETKSGDIKLIEQTRADIQNQPKTIVEKVARIMISDGQHDLDFDNPADKKYAEKIFASVAEKGFTKSTQESVISDAVTMVKSLEKQSTSADASGVLAMIPAGRSLTKRNVATSRLASMLDSDSIVAKSVPMQLVKKEGQEEKIVSEGVIMATATGMDVNDITTQSCFMYAEGLKDPKTTMTVSSQFLKEATTLHVMDLIAGQTDRHSGNAFYKMVESGDEIRLDGLIAIDNDMSFGTTSYESRLSPAAQNLGTLESLSHIDKDIYDKVMSMDGEMLEYMLGDTIEPDAMTAAQKRLQEVQSHIASGKVRIVDDWSKIKEADVTDLYASRFSEQVKQQASDVFQAGKKFKETFGIDMDAYLGMGYMGKMAGEYQSFQNSQVNLYMGRKVMPTGVNLKNPVLLAGMARLHAAYGMREEKLEAFRNREPFMLDRDLSKKFGTESRTEDKRIAKSADLLIDSLSDPEAMKQYVGTVLTSMYMGGNESGSMLEGSMEYLSALEFQYPDEAAAAKVKAEEYIKFREEEDKAERAKEAAAEAEKKAKAEAEKKAKAEAEAKEKEGTEKKKEETKEAAAEAPQTSASPQKTQVKFKELTKEEKKDSMTSERKLRRRAVRFDKDELGKALAEEAKKDAGAVKPGPKGKK